MENRRSFVALMLSLAVITTIAYVLVQFILPVRSSDNKTGSTTDQNPSAQIEDKPIETAAPETQEYIEGPAWDSNDYQVNNSWWYFIDLRTDNEVWLETEKFSEAEFIPAFEKLRSEYKSIRVSINVSPDSDQRFVNRLTAYLKRNRIEYDFYKSRYEVQMDRIRAEVEQKRAAEREKKRKPPPPPEPAGPKEVYIGLKPNGDIMINYIDYPLDQFVTVFNTDYNKGDYVLVMYVFGTVDPATLQKTKDTFTAHGLIYDVTFR